MWLYVYVEICVVIVQSDHGSGDAQPHMGDDGIDIGMGDGINIGMDINMDEFPDDFNDLFEFAPDIMEPQGTCTSMKQLY